MYIVLKFSSK